MKASLFMTIFGGIFSLLGIALAIGLFLSGCGSSHADSGASAHQVTSPLPGYTCFVIEDGNGTPVGGNCVKD